jgi:hypothetical protein
MSVPQAVVSPEIAAGVVPQTLGNYQIIRQIGRGDAGTVYLARQVTLDRPAALEVVDPERARNPSFLVRFTREAYAAVQLVHHNIVRIYEIGSDRGFHYVSTEFVDGQTLDQLQKAKRKLPAEEAAVYILQAARGLQFAHERGVIHRDVKPDSIVVSHQGVVKVAGLGLVSDSGTPGYVAPEQARDAQLPDGRSDIYSLGCTFYLMATGQPVFTANNIEELFARHAADPVTRPDAIVKGLPRVLSDVIVKMIAKRPAERYQSMAEVGRVLEDFLQIEGADRLARNEQCIGTIERAYKAFHDAGPRALRTPTLLAFFCGCAALFAFLLLIHTWKIAGCILGVGLLTGLAHFVVHGSTHRDYLFRKIRESILSCSWRELVKPAAAVLLFCLVLWLFGLLVVWMLAALLAVFLAIGFHFAIDRRIAWGRSAALENIEAVLKPLRLRGVSEETLHEFVSRNTGNDWEEFFEALFGYEAKLSARLAYAGGPGAYRPRFAAWREPLVRWLDRFQKTRQETRTRQYLQSVEQANLEAQGAATRAREEAERAAAAAALAGPRTEIPAAPVPQTAVATAPPGPPRRYVVEDLSHVRPTIEPSRRSSPLMDLLELVLGSGVRFAVGAALLVISLWWLHSRGLLPGSSNLSQEWVWRQLWEQGQQVPPLDAPGVPEVVRQAVCSLGAAIAGLGLLLSSLWRSPKIGLMTLVGAAVMTFGPVSGLVSAVETVSPFVIWLVVGGGIMALGFLFGRDT